MTDAFQNPRDCDLPVPPLTRIVQELDIPCELPEVAEKIIGCPDLTPTAMPATGPAGAAGPCPSLNIVSEATVSNNSGGDVLTSTFTKDPVECSWVLNQIFDFPCQGNDVTATLTYTQGVTPGVTVNKTSPTTGGPCNFAYQLNFVIPHNCVNLSMTATTTVLSPSSTPYVILEETASDSNAPNCVKSFNFSFGLPGTFVPTTPQTNVDIALFKLEDSLSCSSGCVSATIQPPVNSSGGACLNKALSPPGETSVQICPGAKQSFLPKGSVVMAAKSGCLDNWLPLTPGAETRRGQVETVLEPGAHGAMTGSIVYVRVEPSPAAAQRAIVTGGYLALGDNTTLTLDSTMCIWYAASERKTITGQYVGGGLIFNNDQIPVCLPFGTPNEGSTIAASYDDDSRCYAVIGENC